MTPPDNREACTTPEDHHFWHCDNWPGERAPVEWRITPSDLEGRWSFGRWTGRYHIACWLWVPTPDGHGDLWSYGGGPYEFDELMPALSRFERELEADRDDYLAERKDLAEIQASGMAVPA